jgi:hypothetical protein
MDAQLSVSYTQQFNRCVAVAPTKRTRTIRPLLIAAVMTLAIAATGCYTLLRHPGIPSLNYRRPARDEPCTSCHSRAEIVSSVRPDRAPREPDPWGRLSHPWWIDSAADTSRSDGGQSH